MARRSFSSVIVFQASAPKTAYAARASINRLAPLAFALAIIALLIMVHRGGFEPPYLLRGTDLQSVGFNHSPTCANPKTSGRAKNYTRHCPVISQFGKTKCENSRLTLAGNYLEGVLWICAACARCRVNLFCFRNPVYLELAKGFEPLTL